MSLARFRTALASTREDQPVAEVARIMLDGRVGSVFVTRGARLVGIVTDRDIVLRVVAEGRDPTTTPVSEILTYDPVTVTEDDGIETAAARMRKHGIRRLPIVDADGVAVGIITADDLLGLLGRELGDVCAGIDGNSDAGEGR